MLSVNFLQFIDLAGIAVFSISGVFAAREKKLDVFGVFIIAFITALGGGTLRDILIGNLPVSWMFNLGYVATVSVSTIAAIIFSKLFINLNKILLLFDSLGLGLFTVVGLEKGIEFGLHPVVCIALGTITACFGGVIRDISLNNIPLIFQREIYATACILGGVVYFLLQSTMSFVPLESICIAIIVVIRLIAVKKKWKLPSLNQQDKE